MRFAVVQHHLRTHERMDLAAMLAASEEAADEGARLILYPRIPGLSENPQLVDAFERNVEERAPGMSMMTPRLRRRDPATPLESRQTGLGRTVVLEGDECIDPALFPIVSDLAPETLVWFFNAEDPLQAEAAIELALEASLTLAPLVVVCASNGHARGVELAGTSAVAHLGELVAEAGEGDDFVIADLTVPATMPERSRRLPEVPPVLAQRLAAHRGTKVRVDYPADLS
jgi:hypothetical protein